MKVQYVPEIDVIIAVAKWLHSNGWTIESLSLPRGQGIDSAGNKNKLTAALATLSIEEKNIRGYEDWEKFKQPRTKAKHFFNEYAAKAYTGLSGEAESKEILSLGLEALENAHKFREIMKKDPEHLAIILATIRGF